MDGVVRMPSEFSMTFGALPSMTATHEFVVPRSIPMTLPIVFPLLFAAGRTGLRSTRQGRPPGLTTWSGPPRSDPYEQTCPAALGGSFAHIGGLYRPASRGIKNPGALTVRSPRLSG